ncbi:hypothetical protein [Mycobacterium sp. NAZ190054]|uniref:hypothetical protein n=1 Tax=Mycobacterium sp. NAZ190054 TaxID=1747766 RepID=UPI000797CC9A|nr:hypothetical protein [Mycobacterium sp. NAZ190054]KWX66502.1 hypothetical protein ASJ79_06030 [Mycobacterium sp. NAZ190054]
MNAQMARHIEQIRRRWWVVLSVVAVTVLATAVHSADADATYVGKSLLVQSSPERTPEQDATMAVGYATLFNEPVTIGRLRERTQVPEGVSFEARTVAASPILTIEATAEDPEVAQTAAQQMAAAFRDDINSVRNAGFAKEIEGVERQLQTLKSQREPDGSMNPLVPVVQERLDDMRADATDQLRDLQLRAGVTKMEPQFALQVATGAVGGLFLGALAALGLAAMSPRLMNARDLLHKTGVEPLIEVPRAGSIRGNRLREDRLRMLANYISLQDLPRSAVIALTDCRGARGAQDLAEDLARLSAQQGRRTVLVYANNSTSPPSGYPGFNNVLTDRSLVDSALTDSAVDSLKILPAGPVIADRYPLLSRERIDTVLDELRVGTDIVVVVAPPVTDSIDSHPVCAAADLTILVVGKRVSRSGDVAAAAEALTKAHAVLLGAVLVDGKKRRSAESQVMLAQRANGAVERPTLLDRQR